jgi:hypothetical protein
VSIDDDVGRCAPRPPLRAAPRPGEIARLAVIALVFLAAPVAGDIGSCSQGVDALDPVKFFAAKQAIDCQQCTACDITTHACMIACGAAAVGSTFPANCVPLEHDGEVCLDALLAASCSDYQSYVADQGATIPTECDFCPPLDGGAP